MAAEQPHDDERRVTFSIKARWLRTALVVAVTAAVVAPVAAFAGDRFGDVPSSSVFHDDIGWLADAGVTKGCNPPDNTEFCPDEDVTREQMAAFLRRLAENQVVDADTVDGTEAVALRRPIAMDTGSILSGTRMEEQNGEIARITLDAPAAGVVKLEHTESWDIISEFSVLTWVEEHQPGAECNSLSDGFEGTAGAAGNRFDDSVPLGTSAGAGHTSVPAGPTTFSLCLDTGDGTSDNIDWSVQAAWYPDSAFQR